MRKGCGVDSCLKHHHPLIHGAAPVFAGAAVVGCSSPPVLLQLVPLLVETPKGDIIHTYALLDSGSQATLILEKFADEVGREGSNKMLTLGTIDSKEVSKPSRNVSFSVKAASNDSAAMSILIPEAWPHVADLDTGC